MGSYAQLDHQATWNEVCEALALSSLESNEFVLDAGFHREPAVQHTEGVGLLAEELAWLALARRVLDPVLN